MESVSKDILSRPVGLFKDHFVQSLYNHDYKTRNKIFVSLFKNLDVIDIPDHGVPQIGKSDFQNPKGWVNLDNKPPYEPGWTQEDYLKLVPHFEDPYELIVKEHDGIQVLRDDLIPGNLGSKARYAEVLMQEVKSTYLTYAMVAQGQAGKVLATVAKKYNKMVILIAPWRKEPTTAHIEAMKHGAIMLYYKTGGMAGARKRCRAFIHDQLQDNGMYVPAGVKHPIITAGFMKSAMQLNKKFTPDIVVSVASTMVMNHGLQLAFPNSEVHAIQVAGNAASKKWPGRAIIKIHNQPFNEPCPAEYMPPFPSIPEYDAKGWKYAVDLKNKYPEKTVLFWNVAGQHTLDYV